MYALYRLTANFVSVKLLRIKLRLRCDLLLVSDQTGHVARLLRLVTEVTIGLLVGIILYLVGLV